LTHETDNSKIPRPITFDSSQSTKALNPYFLASAAILGGTCSALAWLTGSIWPAIFAHAFLVFVWQSFFGGLELTKGTVN